MEPLLMEMNKTFNEHVKELLSAKGVNSFLLSKDDYLKAIEDVKEKKSCEYKRRPQDYQFLRRYDVAEFSNKEKLIFPANENDTKIRFYAHTEELFIILHDAHNSVGHGGRDRMRSILNEKYKNITKEVVMAYLNLCEICQGKLRVPRKGVVVKPILSTEMNSRCQVDLIDMQSQPDRVFKFIMVYQDHLTKFVQLRPLMCKKADLVAYHLLDIFLTFGAPSILQSDNGMEFCAKIIEETCSLWPELKIVHGKPRHSQSQGSVERANQDIENMLSCWQKENNTTRWAEGLRFVQFMKNRAYHSGIKCSPYEAMFGCKAKVGLATTLTPDVLLTLDTQEELQSIMHTDKNDTEEKEDQSGIDETPPNPLKEKVEQVRKKRKVVQFNLEKQAEKMISASNAKFAPANLGESVRVPVPDLDRGRSDSRNILAVILEKNNDGLYKLGTNHGVLNQFYARNQFAICKEQFITINDVPDKMISLRECSRLLSMGGGQGYSRCNCRGNCKTKICKCRKEGKLCNSKCHQSSTCCNK
ncbi:KRAB-A domain-containing protein 2-like [Phymastichus coffea]|uniref:KRAB-A domain-containing protein 2-like n=1 Tax=Phymastichus coffea TaxID=108790 RepID=UPI00273A98B2|nr:KRAB-A domain-containing protein 2-like [Phymastichus coffea]